MFIGERLHSSRKQPGKSIRRAMGLFQREFPVDLLEFFDLTPLPGFEDHLRLVRAGTLLDRDLHKYDLESCHVSPPRMSREERDRTYLTAWQSYCTIDHVETALRRLASVGAMLCS
jgi:hypothetical protein